MAPDGTMTIDADALAGALAERIGAAAPSPGPVRLLFIGDDGLEERAIGPDGTVVTDSDADPDATTVRWEYVEDALAVDAGALHASGVAHAARLVVEGTDEAVNALAPILARAEDTSSLGFIPWISRVNAMSDAEVGAVLARDGAEHILREQLDGQADAYGLIELGQKMPGFRGRWRVDGSELDLVLTEDRCWVEAPPAGVEASVTMNWEPVAWMRWIGGMGVTFMDALVSGRLVLEGDPSVIQASAVWLPHIK